MAIQNTERDNFVNSEKFGKRQWIFFIIYDFLTCFCFTEKFEIITVEIIRENEMV